MLMDGFKEEQLLRKLEKMIKGYKKLEGDVAVAETRFKNFLADPKGVAEHIDFVDTVEKKTLNLQKQKTS